MAQFKLFYCYAKEDKEYQDNLSKHLSTLKDEGIISGWHDGMIQPGQVISDETKKNLGETDIFLLLVSSNSLANKEKKELEIKVAIEKEKKGELKIIPVLCKPFDWENSIIGKFKQLPHNGKPISRWEDKDEAYFDITKSLRSIITPHRRARKEPLPRPILIKRILPTINSILKFWIVILIAWLLYVKFALTVNYYLCIFTTGLINGIAINELLLKKTCTSSYTLKIIIPILWGGAFFLVSILSTCDFILVEDDSTLSSYLTSGGIVTGIISKFIYQELKLIHILFIPTLWLLSGLLANSLISIYTDYYIVDGFDVICAGIIASISTLIGGVGTFSFLKIIIVQEFQ